ncbi:MAG: efflux RND transporter periplasmic adaptor subunit [Lentisphaerae bacterium]|nr:efflux RND transporter periplasmic adaptor subunit [Lentisphaerota bacterium]
MLDNHVFLCYINKIFTLKKHKEDDVKTFIKLAVSSLVLSQSIAISTASENPRQALPSVVVEKASPAASRAVRRYVGSVEAINSVNIMPRITGELRKVNFTEGSLVKAGQLLYELEDTTYQAAVQALEAQLEAQKATLEFATTEYARKYKLLKSNVVSTAAHEQALMEINVAKANIKRLEASLTDARNTLSYTKIVSPINGRIGKSIASVGNLITPQSGAMADIQQLAPIYVKFSISEKVLRRDFGGVNNIAAVARVKAMLADGKIASETARITLVDNKINAKSNTITMWATFPNTKFELLPGSFVTVLLTAEDNRSKTPSVLPSAVVMENDSCFVWVLDNKNNIPSRRKVKIGDTVAGRLLILDGVKNGETVVVDGTHKIRPNTPVVPVDAKKVFTAGK